jgi:hypothetical protein
MGDERTDIEQKELEIISRAAIGVQPVLREAAEVMKRLSRDTDPKLYDNWLDWLVLQKLPPPNITDPLPETDPTRAAAPAARSGPPDDDSPEARRAKRR